MKYAAKEKHLQMFISTTAMRKNWTKRKLQISCIEGNLRIECEFEKNSQNNMSNCPSGDTFFVRAVQNYKQIKG